MSYYINTNSPISSAATRLSLTSRVSTTANVPLRDSQPANASSQDRGLSSSV